jgi:hypothetical protein
MQLDSSSVRPPAHLHLTKALGDRLSALRPAVARGLRPTQASITRALRLLAPRRTGGWSRRPSGRGRVDGGAAADSCDTSAATADMPTFHSSSNSCPYSLISEARWSRSVATCGMFVTTS